MRADALGRRLDFGWREGNVMHKVEFSEERARVGRGESPRGFGKHLRRGFIATLHGLLQAPLCKCENDSNSLAPRAFTYGVAATCCSVGI